MALLGLLLVFDPVTEERCSFATGSLTSRYRCCHDAFIGVLRLVDLSFGFSWALEGRVGRWISYLRLQDLHFAHLMGMDVL